MIKREKTEWGVRLVDYPFDGLPKNSEMYVQAEIRGTDIRFWFSGTTVRQPLRRADALIWMGCLKAVFDAALKEAK
jgi:hypothetical protein